MDLLFVHAAQRSKQVAPAYYAALLSALGRMVSRLATLRRSVFRGTRIIT